MFGHRRRIADMEARADDLESGHAKLGTALAAMTQRLEELERAGADNPEQRLALALAGISTHLAGELQQTLAELGAMRGSIEEMKSLREQWDASLGDGVCRAPRVFGELGQTYRAEWTGYVCLYFTGGTTDVVELRVGDTSPPTKVVSGLNTRSRLGSYAGSVVRRGEYWLATSTHEGGSGVRCVFTPFA